MHRPTVLVVDDEPLIGLAVADVLEDSYVVLVADSGAAGLRLLAEHPEVAVILCDQRMPRMEGHEFLARACEISQAVRILVTGYADLTAVVKAVNQGHIHSYLAKPFDPPHLQVAVGSAYRAHQIADQLRHERELLCSLMDNMPDRISFRDVPGRFIRVNRAKTAGLGIDDPDMAVGRRETDFTPAAEAAMVMEAEHLTLEDGGLSTNHEWSTRNKDGERWWSTISAAIRDPSGLFVRSVAITRDITDSKAMERSLQQAMKMEAIGNLTSGMAHDFNNLLAVVIGNLELLSDTVPLDGTGGELVAEATGAAMRGAELTHSLLAFSRRQALQPTRFHVNERVSEMMKLLRRLLGEDITTVFSPGEDLWAVVADPVQLESALANVAANARDAMPSGGRFAVETRNAYLDDDYVAINPEAIVGEYVLIQASDTGSGIPPEIIARVIEPFFTTKPVGKGTGLGLSMVYGFVKQSGGHFKIYSEAGIGTTLRIYLPKAGPQISAGDPESHLESVKKTTEAQTILVVDDNVDIRRIAVRQLGKLGYLTHEAGNGPEALVLIDRLPNLELLFTDIVMPGGMNGIELAREARIRRPGLKVLFTSGFPATVITDSSVASDDILLAKPYRWKDLAAHVARALTR
ncbi:MAG: Hybrid sensor histidine kinase/response regulator [Rhodospirillales bacterium]|nr:Hybrid sensor histidine kinase/response regulator [Rhodospirillales bacterium]